MQISFKTRLAGTAFAALTAIAALSVGTASAKELVFGYVPANMAYPYNVATVNGFEEEAKAAGVKTIILDPRGEVSKQGNAIDDLLAQKVDAIGFLPLDSVVAESFVDKITAAGLPSAAVAVQVGDPAKRATKDVYPNLTALIAPDDVLMGEQSAKLAISLLPKDKTVKIAIVEGAPGYASVTQRTEGFQKGLDAAGIKYEIVGSQPTDWTPEKGEAVCQNFLTATPDIDVIYSHADDMAVGCARAISAAGSKAALVSTSGGSKLGNSAISAGELAGTVCMRPGSLGRAMFKALYDAVKNPGGPKAQYVTIDTPILTKENLESCPPEW